MCAIAGMFEPGRPAVSVDAAVRNMVAMLNHRGPDGNGVFAAEGVGLGHARLSIIDVAGGDQPIANEDGSIQVTFNGEVFNYIELRQQLKRRGHRFYTDTDTEVLVHLYEDHGEDFVQYLNGQFAMALWDSVRRRLVLARDRVGITPLFYKEHKGGLLFASEIKALIAAADEAPSVNTTALDQLFTFWAPVSPETLFAGIREIRPGELLSVDKGGVRQTQYWDWRFPDDESIRSESEELLAEELHELLVDATRLRLRADVPVGAYLSGGLDSSVITSLIHHHGDVPLKTFSIGFDNAPFDESEHQQTMAAHLGARDSRVSCKDADIAEHFPTVVWHTEAPVLRTAPAPMYLLSRQVHREKFKVVLTGEGADEVFGGYDIFKEMKIRRFWARNPGSRLRPSLLKRLYPYLNTAQMQSLPYLQCFFGAGLDAPDSRFFSHMPRWNTTAGCKTFFSRELKAVLADEAALDIERLLPDRFDTWQPFQRAQYLEAKTLMAGYLLCSQGDRMLMANSVEGRFPFLDHRLIEFANRLPPKLKMRGLKEKYLLKKAAGKYLPKKIVNRHKQPYRAPDIPAFFGGRYDYVDDLLSDEKLREYGYFDAEKVGLLMNKIRRGRAIGYKDNMALVGILSTQAWHHMFIDEFRRNCCRTAA